eukprot:TRINITY_DN31943_c0_g1_i1.p1 TRINITY_DN31943_c0_g1~~TRINITY_DN31943_c0_g1_i1.p1  ORF type:complete len:634 (+),score=100.40 TRINITY_DN31943_c0_g1_i1:79-1980(+)
MLSSLRQSVSDSVKDTIQSTLEHTLSSRVQFTRPACYKCQQTWKAPRPVVYRLVACVPPHIQPSTQDAVIAHQTCNPKTKLPSIRQEVVENFQYTYTAQGVADRLVEEFAYEVETGAVSNDLLDSDEHTHNYARLITLNNWYRQLFQSTLFVAFTIMDLQANFMLAVSLCFDLEMYTIFPNSGVLFFAFWGLSTMVSVAVAVREALWEWDVKASPAVGDLIETCHWTDRVSTFLALVAFRLFSVQTVIKDIVTLLHPWKSVQPFAAIKCENARSYIIAWPHRSLFEVENLPGATLTFPIHLISKSVIFGLKVYFVVWYRNNPSLFLACFSSVFSVFWGWIKLYRYWCHRCSCYRWLLDCLQRNDAESPQWLTASKLLALHFKLRIDSDGILRRLSRQQFKEGVVAEKHVEGVVPCVKCGRLPDSLLQPEKQAARLLNSESWDASCTCRMMAAGLASWHTAPCSIRPPSSGMPPEAVVDKPTSAGGTRELTIGVPASFVNALDEDGEKQHATYALLFNGNSDLARRPSRALASPRGSMASPRGSMASAISSTVVRVRSSERTNKTYSGSGDLQSVGVSDTHSIMPIESMQFKGGGESAAVMAGTAGAQQLEASRSLSAFSEPEGAFPWPEGAFP